MKALLPFILLSLCASTAAAETPWPHRQFLGHYVSHPQEPVRDFLLRLGRLMQQRAHETGHESCGVIGQRSDQFGVSLYTDGVQRGCSMRWSQTPPGFTHIQQTVHSHPVSGTIVLTERDRQWNTLYGVSVSERIMTIQPGFSRADRAAGPGWLVENGVLLFYDGKVPLSRRMGVLATPEQMPVKLDP